MKRCLDCSTAKPLSEFYRSKKGHYQSYCKSCSKKRVAKFLRGKRAKQAKPKPTKVLTKDYARGPHGQTKLCKGCGLVKTRDQFYTVRGHIVSHCETCIGSLVRI